MKKLLTSAPIFLLVAAALSVAAFTLLTKGFKEIEQIRQLERIPEISINTVLQGEVSIRGDVEVLEPPLDSRYTSTPSVYYRFLHEEEQTDSDGDSHWVTVLEEEKSVNFTLTDPTGSIDVVTLENSLHPIKWSMPSSMRKTIGEDRYTEWRIEPGQQIHAVGYAVNDGDSINLSFTPEGLYTAMLSTYGPTYERQQMGKSGIFYIWLGLVALAFCVLCMIWALSIHRVIAYLSCLTAALTLVLVQLGIVMLSKDIKASVARLYVQYEVVQEAFNAVKIPPLNQSLLLSRPINYSEYADNGVDEYTLERLSALKVNLALYQAQLNRQLDQFPDNIVGWSIGVDTGQKPLELNKTESELIEQKLNNIKATTVSDAWVKWIPLIALIGMMIGSYIGFRKIRFKRFIESIPTSKVSGVVYGLAEVKGHIKCITDNTFLTTPITGKKSVWYYYKKEEKQKSGKNEKWVTLIEERNSVPFITSDYTGDIKIIADNAEVITKNKKVTREGRYRHTEQYLKPNETLYVIGSAKIDTEDQSRLVIASGDKSDPFILSNLSEQQVMLRKARNGMIFLNLAFSALLLGVLLMLANNRGLSPDSFLISALSAPLFMMALMAVLHYNDIIFLRQRVERNIANIKVILQKRYDLLPNLEKAVKQYLAHEESLLSQIAALRKLYNPDSKKMSNHDQSISKNMRLIIEQYPDLKSQQGIAQLIQSATQIEDELAMMKSGYLDGVEIYNSRIQAFPDLLLAKLFGFKEHKPLSWNG